MTVAAKKEVFSAIPRRANADRRLTDRDYRILGTVAAYDRMSKSRGAGQGAWASQGTMSRLVGSDYSRFSVSINRLVKYGYLEASRFGEDRRKKRYRVIYTDEDRLPDGQLIELMEVCASANDPAGTSLPEGGKEPADSLPSHSHFPQKTGESEAQYISLSEEINSVETDEINSSEDARFAARSLSKMEFSDNVGAQLARIERALKAGKEIDCLAVSQWLDQQSENAEDVERANHVHRVSELVIDAMNAEEYLAWGQTHGWVDEQGNWEACHPKAF